MELRAIAWYGKKKADDKPVPECQFPAAFGPVTRAV